MPNTYVLRTNQLHYRAFLLAIIDVAMYRIKPPIAMAKPYRDTESR